MNAEFELIERVFRPGFIHERTSISNGDDASVHNIPQGMELAISLDHFVAGIHWPEDFPLIDAGDRAIAAALSDMAAMGAEPAWIWLGVQAISIEAAEAMGNGAIAAMERYGLELAGGDTTRSSVNGLGVTVGGLVRQGLALRRDAAGAGDNVWLIGNSGYASLGLEQWRQGIRSGTYVDHFRKVVPLLDEGQRLLRLGVHCCIDVSDGLIQDASHIARASGLSLHLHVDSIPDLSLLAEITGFETARRLVLSGGEDYALLCTADPSLSGVLREFAICIGSCKEGSGVKVFLNSRPLLINETGYEHFA